MAEQSKLQGPLHFLDDYTYIERDGSNNLNFVDAITGAKTLTELAASGNIQARIENTATTSYLEFGNSGADTFATLRTSNTSSADKTLVIEDGNGVEIVSFDVGGNYYKESTNKKLLVNHSNNYFLAEAGDPTVTDYSGCSSNLATGFNALNSLISGGNNNTAYGIGALGDVTTGDANIGIGFNAGDSITTELQTINIGYQARATGDHAIVIGHDSGGNTSAISLGKDANASDTGSSNIAIGEEARRYGTTGTNNIVLGSGAGRNVTGNNNIILGEGAGSDTINSGYGNILMGLDTGEKLETAAHTVAMGNEVAFNLTTGSHNVLLGNRAGYALTTGGDNIFIGYQAGRYETGSYRFMVSTFAGTNEATGRTAALLYGVTNATPASQTLDVNADLSVTYNFAHKGSNIGFFNTTPVAKATALTASDTSTVDTTYGTEEQDVINNLRTRLDELEAKLQAYGLLT